MRNDVITWSLRPLTTEAAQPLQGCRTWRDASRQRALKGLCSLLHTPPQPANHQRCGRLHLFGLAASSPCRFLCERHPLPFCCKDSLPHRPRWWAGSAISQCRSDFHVALAKCHHHHRRSASVHQTTPRNRLPSNSRTTSARGSLVFQSRGASPFQC